MDNFTIIDQEVYFLDGGKWFHCEVREDGVYKGEEEKIKPKETYSLLEIKAKCKPKTNAEQMQDEITKLKETIQLLEEEKNQLLEELRKEKTK